MGWRLRGIRALTRRALRESNAARKPRGRILGYGLSAALLMTTTAGAAAPNGDLTQLSLEDLMTVEVTSVSKKEEHLFEAPAAVYVITQEDIRRSGATSIAEALRMVPGVDVARIDSNKWAISARGFNDEFANKLLVLLDGRSLYDPLFGGVFWDVQDTMLEDIDRIEVIRGPGGTLWGANAVNGVINIITKSAGDTQGGLVSALGGKAVRGIGEARYGARLGDNVAVRVYGKYVNWDSFVTASGRDAADDWQVGRGGFRLDWNATTRDRVMLQGALYQGDVGQLTNRVSLSPPYATTLAERDNISGGDLLGKWHHDFSTDSTADLQVYYDRTHREFFGAREDRDTFDIDLQHRFQLLPQHEIVWGLGYRLSSDDLRNSFDVALTPSHRNLNLGSAFIQDDITLVAGRLHLIAGSKFEHNDFTGFEFQPSGRLLWTPGARQTLWAAVSRAVRSPTRTDHDVRFNLSVIPPPPTGGFPTIVAALGNPNFASETLLAYELGYRVEPLPDVFLDVATFYNDYQDLRTLQPGTPVFETQPSPSYVQPLVFQNGMDGQAYGVEVAASWRPTSWCRLSGGYTWLDEQLQLDASSHDVSSLAQVGNAPQNQVNTRAFLNLPWNLELDAALYYVDSLRVAGGLSVAPIASYIRPDVRLGWHPSERLDLSVTVQDLVDNHHAEFPSTFTSGQTVEIERAVFGQIRWRF
jgi:iron complex outermembrane receptor protein